MLQPPKDAERRIVKADAPVSFRRVILIHLVFHLYIIGQGQKAVQTAFWDKNLLFIFLCQFDADPLQVGRGAVSNINGNIQQRAARTR